MTRDDGLPKVPGPLLADYFAEPEGPWVPVVVHDEGCTRAPCGCFGITAEEHETPAGFVSIRLLYLDELVGACRLVELGGMLLMYAAATYRASTTEDWAWHHQVVTELLLREAARVADEHGLDLATTLDKPGALLEELGFAQAGTLMRRPAAADPVCTEAGHDHATSSCRGPREAPDGS